MSKNAPPPIGYHPDWLPFIAAVELALRQIGDPDRAMDVVISAVKSWVANAVSAPESWVPVLIEDARGVRRLMTSTDKLRYYPPIEHNDDDDHERLREEWRDETTIELITIDEQGREHRERVLLFIWGLKLEEFLGLRPAVAHEAKEPNEPAEQPEPGEQSEPVEGEQSEPVKGEQPTVRNQIIIAILRKEYGDHFTTDDMTGKGAVVRDHWGAECRARHVSYKLPHRTTIENAIKDYRKRPSVYLKRRIETT
jgi:hypothetical protein